MPTLAVHHKVALVPAVLTSAIALFDAATAAMTGHYSVFAEGSGNTAALLASDLVHGLNYAGLAWVLTREADRLGGYGRVVRGATRALRASLVVLCLGFVLVSPGLVLTNTELDGVAGTVWGLVASIGFFGMILSTLVLGVAVVRRNLVGIGGSVLRLLFPVAAVTILLGVIGSPWAHPAYVETVINVGLALLGAGVLVAATARHERARASA
jgi:hypothetical protein